MPQKPNVTACHAGLDVTTEFSGGAAVPIGQPLANLRAYVLDAELQLLPVGVPGELMISGVQLARGYLKRPDLTADKFIPNPYSGGDPHHDRLYRTGAAQGLILPSLSCKIVAASLGAAAHPQGAFSVHGPFFKWENP